MTLYPIDNKIKRIQEKRDEVFQESKHGDVVHRRVMMGKVNTYDTCLRILQEGIDG